MLQLFKPLQQEVEHVKLLTATAPNGKGISLKWSLLNDNAINVPVIRLSEMYLIRAESNVQKGGFSDAAVRADYNAVRAVAGVAADNTTTGALHCLQLYVQKELLNFLQKEIVITNLEG